MAESRYPATVDALVAALTGAGLTVWDGPITSGDYSNAIYVGYDADPEGREFRAASAAQAWAGVGVTRKRDEDLEVSCAVVVTMSDDTTWKPARDAAYALLDSVGQTLRADPSLGQLPPFRSELEPGEFFQEPGPKGWQARIVFTVRVKTRV